MLSGGGDWTRGRGSVRRIPGRRGMPEERPDGSRTGWWHSARTSDGGERGGDGDGWLRRRWRCPVGRTIGAGGLPGGDRCWTGPRLWS